MKWNAKATSKKDEGESATEEVPKKVKKVSKEELAKAVDEMVEKEIAE